MDEVGIISQLLKSWECASGSTPPPAFEKPFSLHSKNPSGNYRRFFAVMQIGQTLGLGEKLPFPLIAFFPHLDREHSIRR